jgi:starch phosphorylase
MDSDESLNTTADAPEAADKASGGGHELAEDIRRHMSVSLGQGDSGVSSREYYMALGMTLRDTMLGSATEQRETDFAGGRKRVHYLSLEYLMGRLLTNAVDNLQLEEDLRVALRDLGVEFEDLVVEERDPGLGNGGLGRLAACFLDSCATLDLPVTGYGLRYRFGMFCQSIERGYQVEQPDTWLERGYPWEIKRPEQARRVPFFGHTEHYVDGDGRPHVRLVGTEDVMAVPHDIPIPGHDNGRVNLLRLWSAEASRALDLNAFNAGDHQMSVTAKTQAEEITMILYPSDHTEAGKLLRLRQQYFHCSASLQDVIADWVDHHGDDFSRFAELNCFQLNDTHPICAIPELMRLLMDEHEFEWDEAWDITAACMAYTNHTLLPEALEVWQFSMFEYLLPRIAEIILEIDRRFCTVVDERWPGDEERLARMCIVSKGDYAQVRMSHLGIVGGMSVNGVAELHSGLLKSQLFADFYALWPEKFNNKTNGVTHRRWLSQCNPALAALIDESIGQDWVMDAEKLSQLSGFAEDADFRQRWHAVKQGNKTRLAELVKQSCDVEFDVDFLFDTQVKRIHEYKRQLLNALHMIHLYDRIKAGDTADMIPRCVLVGGKAAPSYAIAKLIIRLITGVASTINADPETADWLRVAFLPNYGVSTMEVICPGTDLSEQISTAGKEASGTGNMKFMMNGALTIGTMDGANIEIHEAVGEAHFFRFGLTTEEVLETRKHYEPEHHVDASPELQRVLARLASDEFAGDESGIFQPLLDALLSPTDPWMTLVDFSDYIATQRRVGDYYRDREAWVRSSILNAAFSGRFSSDRTIRDYAEDIWGVPVRR